MQKRKRLVVGNWKMNPTSISETKRVVSVTKKYSKGLKNTEVVICPPFPFLYLVKPDNKRNVYGGMQDAFFQSAGSFTGEISSEMGREFGVSYVIIGHSERRALGETDEMVSKKVQQALQNNITPQWPYEFVPLIYKPVYKLFGLMPEAYTFLGILTYLLLGKSNRKYSGLFL